MNISQIYERYPIPSNLALHMYRVAAVAKIICDSFLIAEKIDPHVIITACLLHDTGNLIKFDLKNYGSKFLGDELDYWIDQQKAMKAKYGTDEHYATLLIAKEIGVGDQILKLLTKISSSQLQETAKSTDWNRKICSYADMRVIPTGVVSLDMRFEEATERYKLRKDYEDLKVRWDNAKAVEDQIQEQLQNIDVNEITEKISEKLIDELRLYPIN